ncbi:hypothetical protein BBR47_12820 [Brevibacillus brevis NBRC 100599]|uniref:Uncharacterized protein n=1 Tax=Brevibacillus brevis (strain 47 / JCM 6285 / NBRC 100599) TaxID=358681 RepID=C0Z7L6_BREBN|nr:deaminase domain-containing protein [Brevibacillus brevis]BAH42259.1 hypothetical protein BBR47_12820 [Brevibacillus brevis NBRC 100599]
MLWFFYSPLYTKYYIYTSGGFSKTPHPVPNEPVIQPITGSVKEHAAKSLDIPNKNVLPKVVNGDSGHSNYSPSMNSKANPSKALGKIKLFTEIDTCASCSRVIEQFHRDYPGIDIEVIHNDGNIIVPE